MTFDLEDKKRTIYRFDEFTLEKMTKEVYDRRFSLSQDQQEYASDGGACIFNVTGETGYFEEDVNSWIENGTDETHIARCLLNRMQREGHIPKGEYHITCSF